MKTYAIATALVEYEKTYLIAKRSLKKQFSPSQWEFISGFVEEKESAEETILRELEEETNLKGEVIKSAKPFVIIDEEARWIVIPYLIKVNSDKVTINSSDHIEYIWATRTELNSYSDIKDFISKFKEVNLLS